MIKYWLNKKPLFLENSLPNSILEKQISSHEKKIETENPPKDTTINYWKKEIEEKFKKIKQEDEKYLEENKNK